MPSPDVSSHARRVAVALCIGWCLVGVAGAQRTLASKPAAAGPATILDLQPFRQSESVRFASASGRAGSATLVNLNPSINTWFVLTVALDETPARIYHLENPKSQSRRLSLDQHRPTGLFIQEGNDSSRCDLFTDVGSGALEQARQSKQAFAPICSGRVYVRNTVIGHRTRLEAATEFLRDHLWGGEAVIGLGHQIMSDTYRETGEALSNAGAAAAVRALSVGPAPATVDPAFGDRVIAVPGLGITMQGAGRGSLVPGAWYPTGVPGSYVSVMQPDLVAAPPKGSKPTAIDSVEARSLCYLVAFDLDRFRVGYARGTTHPQLGWSAHIPPRMRDPALPGPDGIDSPAPLESTGLVPPYDVARTVATFTAGFKRAHGAFLYGELSLVNGGTHYGFIENGVVFSRLQPALSTLFVLDDGTLEMRTWAERDNSLLPRIRFARQNGVPIVEFDQAQQTTVPGRLVNQWGAGNWSGSGDRKLRTMRSGAALQVWGGKRYLVYAVFSSATPAGMVRVFQAYRCQYAMLLDMNALEHTYFAFYRPGGTGRAVEYLMAGMREVDSTASGEGAPLARFVDYSDNRDFFYVMRRDDDRRSP